MKIAVTGGAGFIGSNIVDAYIAAGHEVVVFDNFSTGKPQHLNPKARLYTVDINHNSVHEIFARERFDVLNHHAAQISVRASVENPMDDAATNIIGSINLYEAARKSGVKKIIFASSGGAVYGEQRAFPATEHHSKRPCSPYGVSKLANEKYITCYHAMYGIEYVILRYTNVYGPRQNPHGEAGVVAIFIEKMLRGEQPIINGSGTQTRDYVYIDDVVQANLDALQSETKGVFNVCTATEHSVNTLFHLIKGYTQSSCRELHAPPKLGEQMRSVCSYERIKSVTGWTPKVSLENGLLKTITWFRAQHHGLSQQVPVTATSKKSLLGTIANTLTSAVSESSNAVPKKRGRKPKASLANDAQQALLNAAHSEEER
jgi:UDP-glucose 4-epimerase